MSSTPRTKVSSHCAWSGTPPLGHRSGNVPMTAETSRCCRTTCPGDTGGRFTLLVGLVLALTWLITPPCPGAPHSRGPKADPLTVRILHTADLHGIMGHDAPAGGWLRVATAIRRVRGDVGAENCLLIDCGDSCQGSPVATLTQGEVGVTLLQHLDYDVWVPGNHELDFGVPAFLRLTAAMDPTVLCGNISVAAAGDLPRTRFSAWRLFERGGVRVAVIGATAGYMHHWFSGDEVAGLRVEPARDMLEKLLGEVLTATPDVIVLACHQGWLPDDPRGVNEVRTIAETMPEIDLILGGHTHRPIPGMRIGWRTWYTQPGQHGDYLGVVTIEVDRHTRDILEMTSELLPTGEDARDSTPDPQATTAVEHWLKQCDTQGKQAVGTLETEISSHGTPGINCQTSDLLCRAIARAAETPLALHGRLTRAGLFAGTVREKDLFFLVPYENTIVTLEVTRKELEHLVEEQLQHRGTYVFCGLYGVECQVYSDKRARIAPDQWAQVAGSKATQRVRLAVNSYSAAGGGGRFPLLRALVDSAPCQATYTGILTRDALRDYLGEKQPVSPNATPWLRVRRQPAPQEKANP